MFRLRMVGKIVRQAGLGHITLVFFVAFFLCAAAIRFGYPQIGSFGDALWLCFQSVTTIGFGDCPTDNPLCRGVIVFLSVLSIFYLAVITGVVVAYCNQLVQAKSRESIVKMAHDLEHLEDLSKDELREISAKARKLR